MGLTGIALRGVQTPQSGIEPILLGNQLRAWARLGPFSVMQTVACPLTQTVDRDMHCRGRSPNRVA